MSYYNQEQEKISDLEKCNAALLEALERVVASGNAIHMDEQVYFSCLQAIKLARGE